MSHVWLSTLSRLATILILLVVLSLVSPAFLSVQNLVNILRQASLLFLLASGLTIVILTAGIDLSIGSVLAFSASVAANFIQQGWIWAGSIVGLVIGAGCGLLNGLMVAVVGLPPFIATYGMLWIAAGFAQVFMKGEIISGFPPGFRFLGAGHLTGIPVPILVMIVVLAVCLFTLRRTNLGRYVYIIGANREAARLSGINIRGNLLLVYSLSGLISAFAGLVYISRINAVESTIGEPLLLPAIAAVCIGGTSLFGGEGGIGGTMVGALIMTLVTNGMNLLNVSPYWQSFVMGAIVVLAVAVDQLGSEKADRA
ncbi:MAG TPA: ABC transporter permease [Candidatus Methylomirabilis sp.]|nr:ABC transporter permease [Candidatus Methylomirabilis sp.]